jgi:NAD(P)-dependent dehydrogenase (short-subunit alcohol dehydrogenase family)
VASWQILDRFRLDGRVAIVTGSSSGLGVAFATGLCEAGASVVLAARRADCLDEVQRRLQDEGHAAVCVVTDVSDPESCRHAVDVAVDAFGGIDILVNNAGMSGTVVPAIRQEPEDFRRVIDTNLNGCYWMAQACAQRMSPGSAIVNVSSVLALTTAELPLAAYAASKAGLLGLTRDLAQQWTGRKGIRVNALAPGYFDSEMTAEFDSSYVERQMERILLDRWGHAWELAAALVFLVSEAGGYVTGQTLVVDGGFTLT